MFLTGKVTGKLMGSQKTHPGSLS